MVDKNGGMGTVLIREALAYCQEGNKKRHQRPVAF
jgi:hypothetical protein